MHRLQPIPDIWQGASDQHRHSISHIRLLGFLVEFHRKDPPLRGPTAPLLHHQPTIAALATSTVPRLPLPRWSGSLLFSVPPLRPQRQGGAAGGGGKRAEINKAAAGGREQRGETGEEDEGPGAGKGDGGGDKAEHGGKAHSTRRKASAQSRGSKRNPKLFVPGSLLYGSVGKFGLRTGNGETSRLKCPPCVSRTRRDFLNESGKERERLGHVSTRIARVLFGL